MIGNVELLQKVLDYITERPEEHDQEVYARKSGCGTAGCVAGHTVAMTGHILNYDGRLAFMCDGKLDIWLTAQDELGLDQYQADALFDGKNTLADLWGIADEITEGAIKIPAGVTS